MMDCCGAQPRVIFAHMFDNWTALTLGHRTLHHVNRPVMVNTLRAFPPSGIDRRHQPLWIRGGGLRLEHWMPGYQTAWLLREDSTWLAAVTIEATSTNGLSQITLQLWLLPDDISTDMTRGR